jgi:hypothetical protein
MFTKNGGELAIDARAGAVASAGPHAMRRRSPAWRPAARRHPSLVYKYCRTRRIPGASRDGVGVDRAAWFKGTANAVPF